VLSNNSVGVPYAQNFNYRNNVLYTTHIEIQDTVTLHAYDITTQTEKWSYRYKIAEEYGNVLTPDFVVVPEIDSAAQCHITFLNVQNGSVVKRSFFPSNEIEQLLYVDSTGTIYRQP
jgi:S-adenosylmethionine hydrolase